MHMRFRLGDMRLPVKLIVLAVCAIAGFGGLMLVADSGLSALSDSLLAQQEDAVIGTRALDLERSCLNVAARLSETIALGVSEGGAFLYGRAAASGEGRYYICSSRGRRPSSSATTPKGHWRLSSR